MTIVALVVGIILGTGSLSWGFAEVGWIAAVRWTILIGLVWLVSLRAGWRWFASVGLLSFVFLSAVGLWLHLSLGWMLAGSIFALFAWDMSDFRYRLIFLTPDSNTRAMERRHLARVSLLSILGLGIASLAMVTQLQFTFEWGVFLVAVVLVAMAQLVAWFRRQ